MRFLKADYIRISFRKLIENFGSFSGRVQTVDIQGDYLQFIHDPYFEGPGKSKGAGWSGGSGTSEGVGTGGSESPW